MSWGGERDAIWPREPGPKSQATVKLSDRAVTTASSPSSDTASEPIAIVPSPSSRSISLHGDEPSLDRAFDSALSFNQSYSSNSTLDTYHRDGTIVDGPLRDLRPPFAVIPSSTSSSDNDNESMLLRSPPRTFERSALSTSTSPTSPILNTSGLTFARRVVSAPQVVFGSPRSPLANEASATTSFANRRRSAQFPLPGSLSNPMSSTATFSPSHLSPQSSRRRRSSVSLSSSVGSTSNTGTPTAPPHGSFVGSFEHSLLTGRLSALPSLPLPFLASIGVLGGSNAPARLKCPPHLVVPFGAFFYSGSDTAQGSSPYVGTIDLEAHHLSILRDHHARTSTDFSSAAESKSALSLPRFPGYRVPIRGQIQLVIKNPNSTAIKLFLVPYDLTGLDRGRQGGKTFVRQKSYAVESFDSVTTSPSTSANSKGRLRYALHLQFCSPPVTKAQTEPHYYLHGNIRVVFASRGLDLTEKLRVVAEGPQGEGHASNFDMFVPYSGPGNDWEMARKKIKERSKLQKVGLLNPRQERARARSEPLLSNPSRHEGSDEDEEAVIEPDLMPDDPNGTTFGSLSQSNSSTPPSDSPFGSNQWSPPSPAAKKPFVRSNLAFSFVRAASPIPALERSGLSSSRPSSEETFGSRLEDEAGR